MCCFFNCNCNNQNVRIIRGPVGPQGPRGPIGPMGPQGVQGIQGPSGTNNAVYASSGASTVATNTIIPLTLNTSSPSSTFTVTGGSVVLPQAGTYLVSYFADGSTTTGNLSTSLYLNGVTVPNENLISTNTAGASSVQNKTVLINAPSGATLSLYNTSADTVTLSNASITAMLLG